MKSLRENLLVQFSVTSFAIIVVIALVISFVISAQLERNIELLTAHGSAMMAGMMIEPSASYSIPSLTNAVGELRLMTFLAMGSGFLFLYLGLVYIVRRGWQTIKRQQTALRQANRRMDAANSQLKMANDDLRDTQEKLVRSERLAAIGELSAAVAHELRNPLGGLSLGADFVKMKIVSGGFADASPLLVPTLSQMGSDVLRANSIITDLLAYARVETIEPSSIDVESLIDQAVSHIELSEDVTEGHAARLRTGRPHSPSNNERHSERIGRYAKRWHDNYTRQQSIGHGPHRDLGYRNGHPSGPYREHL